MTSDEESTALEHLQRAASEMIAAARTALDVLDNMISDPPPPTEILGHLMQWLKPPGHPAQSEDHKPVEHIPVR